MRKVNGEKAYEALSRYARRAGRAPAPDWGRMTERALAASRARGSGQGATRGMTPNRTTGNWRLAVIGAAAALVLGSALFTAFGVPALRAASLAKRRDEIILEGIYLSRDAFKEEAFLFLDDAVETAIAVKYSAE
jgi:hypothetical protein